MAQSIECYDSAPLQYNAPDDVQRKLGRRVGAIQVQSGTLGDALQAQCGSLCASRVT